MLRYTRAENQATAQQAVDTQCAFVESDYRKDESDNEQRKRFYQ